RVRRRFHRQLYRPEDAGGDPLRAHPAPSRIRDVLFSVAYSVLPSSPLRRTLGRRPCVGALSVRLRSTRPDEVISSSRVGGRKHLAQLPLEHLAVIVLGQRLDEYVALGPLEAGDARQTVRIERG